MRASLSVSIRALLALSAWLSACGPSVQSIYEGDVRFEHCYRLDLDLEIAPTHREACWSHWLQAYTYGQPRDRIEYARRRVRAFSNGDISRPLLEVSSASKSRQFYLAAPEPTSVHAPPPPIAPKVEVPPPPPSAAPDPIPAPADLCAKECRTKFETCQSVCSGDAAAPEAACKGCPADYKVCMRRCFQ
ncbi:MAG TPA: hypothetical protein VFQ61_29665 [Polyangiaceae bacterium]|nr:hypothetical protein [Polyangiaceae bacterium]